MKALVALPVLLLASWGGSIDLCNGEGSSAGPPASSRPVKRRPPAAVRAMAAADMCVTSGKLQRSELGRMKIDGPKMRSVAPASSGDVGEIRFLYRGGTAEVAPLASGQIRRQVGLKLRAQDGCNLVYVMWRIEPGPGIEVQIKRNQGKRVHKECGTRGYREVSPSRHVEVPTLQPGTRHTLRAEISGQELIVLADGVPVWEGDLGPDALAIAGPVGVRSDNVALDLELFADPPKQAGALAKVAGRCENVSDD
jgi:hypothetical protein